MTMDETKIGKPLNAAWINKYKSKLVSAEDAVRVIKSGDKIIVQPGCAAPLALINAMVERKDDLFDVEIYHILVVGKLPYAEPGLEKHFKHKAFFIGTNTRKAINEGRAEYIPIFLSEVTLLFKRKIISPFACKIPLLFPPANPIFFLSFINFTEGKSVCTSSTLPSVLPLSTMMISN